MLLYDSTVAPNPRRVRIFLAEKGIEIAKKEINIGKGEHKTPEYRKIAPNARLPALQLDDGSVILETMAICRYFEAMQPEPALLGTGALEQAMVEMWQRRMELELFMPLAMAFRHSHPAMAALQEQFADFGQSQLKLVDYALKALNRRLSDSAYLAGDNYSVADITAQTGLEFFMRLVKREIPAEHEATLAWLEGLQARPSSAA